MRMIPILLPLLAAAAFLALALWGIGRLKESSASVGQAARELLVRLQAVESDLEKMERTLNQSMTSLREELGRNMRDQRQETASALRDFGERTASHLGQVASLQTEALEGIQTRVVEWTRANETRAEALRESVDRRMGEIREGNEKKLDQMRGVVEERLQEALERRLGESFSAVSARLEQVHQGLGEMKALASDVGDLKRVLSNVKTRGTWGEVMLGRLLEQILAPEQYACNVATRPGSSERVEFALKLPGRDPDGGPVWLPMDAKFPQEDYLRLVAAAEAADGTALAEAREALRRRILAEAKDIRTKYLEPPATTDFGILYLPVEGLYAEVLRIDGLSEILMREQRVVVAGPTTAAALLNSLQMGFRTLAVERRTSQVWALLGRVKTEFSRFGDALEKTRKKIREAETALDGAATRGRAIQRNLASVEALPEEGETEAAELASGEPSVSEGTRPSEVAGEN
jgi:DNA recombination protein RmuC